MNVKNIRIGNDILISWSVWANQEDRVPFDFTNKTVKLMMKRGLKEWEMPFSINGNTLSTTFYGKDQDQLGGHTLYLVVNDGLPNMNTVDACAIINLVPSGCKKPKSTDCSEIAIESAELCGDLTADKIVGVINIDSFISDTSENPVQNKVIKSYIDTRTRQLEQLGSAAYCNKADFEAKGTSAQALEHAKIFTQQQDYIKQSTADSKYQKKGNYLTKIPSEYITENSLSSKGYATKTYVNEQNQIQNETIANKQDKLISGVNISTVQGRSVVGKGDVPIYHVITSFTANDVEEGHDVAFVSADDFYSTFSGLPVYITWVDGETRAKSLIPC